MGKGPITSFLSSVRRATNPSSGYDQAERNRARVAQDQGTSNQAYLNRIRDMVGGGSAPTGGYTTGGRSSRGGGGGGFDYYAWQKQQEEERQRQLEERKNALIMQLTGARDQAMPMLDQYFNDYNSQIGNIYSQNAATTSGYNQQLQGLQGQMNQGTQQRAAGLRGDLQGQGAVGGPEMQALQGSADRNVAGTDFLSLLAQQYNTRLAQVMAQRQADAQSLGAATRASSQGQLQNSYAQLLGQIGMIGLT